MGLVDKAELGVLGEMYDIPVLGSFIRPGRSMGKGNVGELRVAHEGNVPSPRRPHYLSLYQQEIPDTNTNQTYSYHAQAMSSSQSLPGGFESSYISRQLPYATAHANLLPQRPTRPGSASPSGDDRFTSMPSRKPRLSKRTSWDDGAWRTARKRGPSVTPGIGRTRLGSMGSASPASRPRHERRITEADEEEESEEADSLASSSGLSAERNLAIPHTAEPFTPTPIRRSCGRKSPLHLTTRTIPLETSLAPVLDEKKLPKTPTTYSSKRRSLQSIPYHPSFSPEAPSPARRSITLQPWTPLTPNPKRRSLQNMPYYSSFDAANALILVEQP
jgi:hypothetical protein